MFAVPTQSLIGDGAFDLIAYVKKINREEDSQQVCPKNDAVVVKSEVKESVSNILDQDQSKLEALEVDHNQVM